MSKSQTRLAVALSVVVAGAVRLLYAGWRVTDFWGDAYHHWLISRLTLTNQWVYADYKGLETVWLPGYHYLISAMMAVCERFDLEPAHWTNLFLGVLACGLVGWLVTAVAGDWRPGLGAGITLALSPWHLAYSHMNMPEVMAGVLLLVSLMAAQRGKAGLLAVLAFVGTLTRHELTLLLALAGLWLGWRRQWRAMLSLAVGSALGLVLWSAWSYTVTGEALAWWRQYTLATAKDASFWIEAGVRSANLARMGQALARAFPVLPVVAPVFVVGTLSHGWRRRFPAEGWLLIAVAAAHWLVLALGFAAGHLPTADPRYVLISLPAAVGAGVLVVAAVSGRWARTLLAGLCGVLLLTSMLRQLPSFRDMAYVLAPERAAGEFLGEAAPGGGGLWVDAPVTVYFSGLRPDRFHSTDRLLMADGREVEKASSISLDAIAARDIEYVLWDNVPYSDVQYIWPQMRDGQPFDEDGYHFVPVFRYSGWELEYGARPTAVWQITGQR